MIIFEGLAKLIVVAKTNLISSLKEGEVDT